MRAIETLAEFRRATLEAGLGPMSDEELRFMKNYYDSAVKLAASLREVVEREDEPATVFRAGYLKPATM